MARNPFISPAVGDVVHHPRFGGGCTFSVRKVFHRKGWDGLAVGLRLTFDDGRQMKPSWRTYSASSWAEWDGEANVVHADTAALRQEESNA